MKKPGQDKTVFRLPDSLVELSKLEKQYPNWDETPESEKEKMVRLALSGGGFWIFEEDRYRDYLVDLCRNLSYRLADDSVEADRIEKKLKWLASILNEFYSPSISSMKRTARKKAKIYVEVERYRLKNTSSSINKAVKEVAKELGMDYQYAYRRYYEMRKTLKGMPLDEIERRFMLQDDSTLSEKMQWFVERLNDFYTRERRKDWVIKRKLANMYLKVENHRKKNKKLSIKKATEIVAKEVGEDNKHVHTRYYEFRFN